MKQLMKNIMIPDELDAMIHDKHESCNLFLMNCIYHVEMSTF
jgi:hypothetical protein